MNELYHYGVLGMKWGVRRYQNPDGSLTAAGRKKYYKLDKNGLTILTAAGKRRQNKAVKIDNKIYRKYTSKTRDKLKRNKEYQDKLNKFDRAEEKVFRKDIASFEQPDRMNAYVELKNTKEYKRALSARKEVEKMIIAQVHNEKWANMKYKDLNLRGPYSKARQISLGKKVASSILNLELGTSPFTVAFDDVDYDKIKF